jgi:hypothetical protein
VVNWHVTVGTGTAVSLQAVKSAIEKGNEAAGNRGAFSSPQRSMEFAGRTFATASSSGSPAYQWHGEGGRKRKSDASLSG